MEFALHAADLSGEDVLWYVQILSEVFPVYLLDLVLVGYGGQFVLDLPLVLHLKRFESGLLEGRRVHLFSFFVVVHSLEFLLGELGDAGALELLQTAADGFIADKHRLAYLGSRALDVVYFGGDEDGGAAEGGGPAPLAHPVSFHALDQLYRREGDALGL